MGSEFLNDHDIIRYSSVSKETRLDRADELRKDGLDPIDNDFRHQLINGVDAQSNGLKVPEVFVVRGLGNKTKECLVSLGWCISLLKDISTKRNSLRA